MRLALTARDAVSGRRLDVLVEVDPAATAGELGRVLAARLRPGSAAAAGPAVSVDGLALARDEPVGAVLLTGCLVALDDPDPRPLTEPAGLLELRVVGGPGAGLVARLPVGTTRVGAGASCDVRLPAVDGGLPVADPALSVDVDVTGACTVRPGAQELRLEGLPLAAPTPWPEGAHLHLGDRVLELRRATAPDAALTPSEDGAGLDLNRPPRLLPPLRRTVFALPRAPSAPPATGIPWVAVLAPLVMAGVLVLALGSARYALFAAMSPVLALANHASGRGVKRRQHRAELARHVERTREVTADAEQALLQERALRRSQAPDPAEVLLLAVGPRARLWERRRDDPDHLALRVGTADLPSDVVLQDPDRPEHRRDVAWQALDAPVVVPLAERGVVGVAGRPDVVRPMAVWMVAQTAVLHSPRDVQVVVLTDPAGEATWDWLRWLPHARPTGGQECAVLVGVDAESTARRIAELQVLLAARVDGGREGEPDVVVVLDGARRLRALPGVVALLRDGPALGLYAVCLDAEERLLPEECSAVVVQTGPTTVTVRQQRADVVADARADLVPPGWAERVSRALAPLRDVSDDGAAGALPASCRLLDVLGLEPPTAAGVAAGWRQGGRTTEAVVGVSLDGPFALDLRRDGPHALVAGTTGAGKSELLQTLVASLAAANRPDAMTFVLVDYKGGSAFQDCVRLPHTVGLVTDLDPHLVQRALTSLRAELHRREVVLASAGAKDLEDHTELVRTRGGTPPPRLLIAIDEFAALARELPEFVTGLVDVAARGRSLGIHLLLATQRPSGVVSPEIRANTDLRIALRVTDRAESTDVVDAPDAALIARSTPGRAYVRLGSNGLVPFQSARVGGRRPGRGGTSAAPWCSPLGWHRLSHPLPVPPAADPVRSGPADTDLGALVEAVCAASEAAGVPRQHSPWLPPLPERLTLDELPPAAPVAGGLPVVPYALADLPGEQAQRPEVVDLATFGHRFVVGSARSGRTQALRTTAGALAAAISTADLHVYGLDCGNGGLLALAALPHCGAVVLRTQTDRAARLLTRLCEELARRQELLAASGFASCTEQRAAVAAPDRLPHVLLVLDRWEGFTASLAELDGGRLGAAMTTLLSEGASAGVHCLVSGDRSLTSYRMSSLTEDRLVLRMSDRADYAAAGLPARAVPDVLPDGRGYRPDGAVEVQVAVLAGALTGQGQADALAAVGAAAALRDVDVARAARPFRLDVLPAQLDHDQAAAYAVGPRPPLWALLGVGGDDLDALGPDLGRTPVFLVAGPPRSGRSTALLTMARSLVGRGVRVVAVAPRPSPLRALAGQPGVLGVLTAEQLTAADLEPLLAGGDPLVLLLDDAELHRDSPAGDLLKTFVRTAGDRGRALVVGGDATALAAGYSGWHADARKAARAGALVSPQAVADGELVGTRLPRSLVAESVRPGRALLHVGDGALVAVTVPLTVAEEPAAR